MKRGIFVRKYLGVILLTGIMIANAAGCSSKAAEETTVVPTTESTTPEPTTQEPTTETETETEPETEDPHEGKVRSYLTGEWVDEEAAKSRPIAVVQSNIQVAIPQSGIGQASVIIEAPAEGMVSRLLAVYEEWDNLEKIGSVRSARTYFVLLQHEFDSIFCHYGQANYALPYIENDDFCSNLNGLDGIGSTVYYRTTDRSAPHNAYASAEGIMAGIDQRGYETYHSEDYESPLHFVEDGETAVMEDAIEADFVSFTSPGNNPWFEYNEEDGLYYRYQYGDIQYDDLTGEQLAVKNIIVRYCDFGYYDGTSYLNFYLTGTSSGLYITDGKAIEITCDKISDESITRYYNASDEEIKINTGKTWILILPETARDTSVISGSVTDPS